MEWPKVAVIIPTYNRPDTLRQTIVHLESFIKYPIPLHYFIGNDGDIIELSSLGFTGSGGHPRYLHILLDRITLLDGPRRVTGESQGLGANLNFLLNYACGHGYEYFFQMDDDHHLLAPLELWHHVQCLIDNPNAGWIRLMGIANHDYTADLRGTYWRVRWDCAGEYSLYIPSNRPHLKHWRFHEYFGLYPTGLTLGETEEGFCHQCKRKALKDYKRDNYDIPHVLVPLTYNDNIWAHVGDSWQARGE